MVPGSSTIVPSTVIIKTILISEGKIIALIIRAIVTLIGIAVSPAIIIRARCCARSGIIIPAICPSISTSSYSSHTSRSQRSTYNSLSLAHKAQIVVEHQGSERYSKSQDRLA
jgi:hypothetical protein